MRITVETDDGKVVALWAATDEGVDAYRYYGPAPMAYTMLNASCPTNVAGSSLVSLLRGAMKNAEAIEAGLDPERPSEKAMRLSEGES